MRRPKQRAASANQAALFEDSQGLVEAAEAKTEKTRDKASLEVVRYVVRVHPFDVPAHKSLVRELFSEAAMLTFVEKMRAWMGKPGKSILVERNGVVWSLWTFEAGRWEEHPQH